MSIPSASRLYLPLLQLMEDGAFYSRQELIEKILPSLNLTEDEQKQTCCCGNALSYESKIKHALTDMAQVGLIAIKEPHVYTLTQDAKDMLASAVEDADVCAYVHRGITARRTQR